MLPASNDSGPPLRPGAENVSAAARERGAFVQTRWSVVLKAARADDPDERNRALESLCRTYWSPLYAWLRGSGQSPEDAEDLVQSLFHDILAGGVLSSIGPNGGRFRSFLMTLLKNLAVDEYRKRGAKKRGGGMVFVPLDLEQGEHLVKAADQGQAPDTAFDRNWARTVIAAATTDLQQNYLAAGRERLFTAIRPCLFGSEELPAYDLLAEELGMSKGAVAMSVMRMRERFGGFIAQRVADTVADPADVREEMRYLLSLFACA